MAGNDDGFGVLRELVDGLEASLNDLPAQPERGALLVALRRKCRTLEDELALLAGLGYAPAAHMRERVESVDQRIRAELANDG